jgi:hypothetical protein
MYVGAGGDLVALAWLGPLLLNFPRIPTAGSLRPLTMLTTVNNPWTSRTNDAPLEKKTESQMSCHRSDHVQVLGMSGWAPPSL